MKKEKKMGKTFLAKQEILSILSFGKKINKYFTTREIVGIANSLGWTTPMDDVNRKAKSHPYSKILSMMTDPNYESYYTPNVVAKADPNRNWKMTFSLA